YPERSGYIQGRWVSRASGHPLSYNLVPGKSIFDREYDTRAPTDHARKMEVSWDDILKGRNAGVAFVCVEGAKGGRKCVTQSIIQLTDLGMTWKVSGGELLAWVFSQRTGLPVAGAKVGQVSRENEAMSTVMTDANGLAYLRLPSHAGWLQATHGADRLLVSLDDDVNEMRLWNFGLNRSWNRDDLSQVRATLFTERSLYRSGETIHLKGVVRGVDGFGTGKLAEVEVSITCRDSRGDTFFEDKLTISRYGSFNTDIPLPAGSLGRYRIKADIQIPGVTPENRGVVESSHWVNVQEFQPDTFKIKFSGKADLPAGSPLGVPLEAQYYFGKPLAGSQVKWSLTGGSVNFYP
ncbi:MAG: MG2 domain-containing protein, partial [Pseudomonadales bacterium]|nr:MG2 domain-containing protein [Pseudomonadales bacterium]